MTMRLWRLVLSLCLFVAGPAVCVTELVARLKTHAAPAPMPAESGAPGVSLGPLPGPAA